MPATCEIHAPDSAARPELESFVQSAFARKHGARIHSFMPILAALRNSAGCITSVAGWRGAAQSRLYLEAYMDDPIETALGKRLGHLVHREEVVEVGNLAGSGCRPARRLVAMLPGLLLARGHRWVVFTATASVRRILVSLNAPLLELAPARAAQVESRSDIWGRYYDNDPRVMAGFLPDGVHLAAALRIHARSHGS